MDHEKALRLVAKTRERKEDDKAKIAKNELADIVATRIKTTMIGALASVERHFDFLWQGSSEDEKSMKEIFRQMRKEILDKGNDQIAYLAEDFDRFVIQANRYSYEFRRDRE